MLKETYNEYLKKGQFKKRLHSIKISNPFIDYVQLYRTYEKQDTKEVLLDKTLNYLGDKVTEINQHRINFHGGFFMVGQNHVKCHLQGDFFKDCSDSPTASILAVNKFVKNSVLTKYRAGKQEEISLSRLDLAKNYYNLEYKNCKILKGSTKKEMTIDAGNGPCYTMVGSRKSSNIMRVYDKRQDTLKRQEKSQRRFGTAEFVRVEYQLNKGKLLGNKSNKGFAIKHPYDLNVYNIIGMWDKLEEKKKVLAPVSNYTVKGDSDYKVHHSNENQRYRIYKQAVGILKNQFDCINIIRICQDAIREKENVSKKEMNEYITFLEATLEKEKIKELN